MLRPTCVNNRRNCVHRFRFRTAVQWLCRRDLIDDHSLAHSLWSPGQRSAFFDMAHNAVTVQVDSAPSALHHLMLQHRRGTVSTHDLYAIAQPGNGSRVELIVHPVMVEAAGAVDGSAPAIVDGVNITVPKARVMPTSAA